MHIIILGPGCPNCKKVEALAKEAASELGIEARFQKVTDMAEIIKYPILRTPGLVLNGEVVSSGRIPTKAEIVSWLATAMAEKT
jgi:small redox-active disulfide protein 2